jgi:hypothetical protein
MRGGFFIWVLRMTSLSRLSISTPSKEAFGMCLEPTVANRSELYNDNKLKLGFFAANCSSGRAATKVPERWRATWDDNLTLAQSADAAGIDFLLPIARWKGYRGETNFHGAVLEATMWACGLLAQTTRITIFSTIHAPLFHPVVAAKQIATADLVGHGRMAMNVVCGWNQDEFDMFALQPAYVTTLTERGLPIPSGYHDYAEHFESIRRVLDATDRTATDRTTMPCNNDLLAANFIDDGDQLWLIDYEYSGNNDPCFELGNIWAECDLSADQLDHLVTAYYGRGLPYKTARARLQGIAGKYGWTLWGCLQSATSPIEFDFWDWAMQRYTSAAAEFSSPRFRQLLDAAQTSD